MKIAVVTNDGKTISQHFGRAIYYMVVTVENGKIINHEMREKANHAHFQTEGHEHDETSKQHGYGPAADNRHGRMAWVSSGISATSSI